MAIDPQYLNPMLDTYRNFVRECEEKGWSGEDFDQMKICLQRMESLGQQLNDISEFSGMLMQENLYMKFSDHYGRLIAKSYKSAYNPNDPYDEKADQALLKQTLNALKDAIRQIKKSKEDSKKISEHASDVDVTFKDQYITDAIQKVIDLGESGISYPQFLAKMMELGLDKAMEGSILQRDGLVYSYEFAKAIAASPFHIQIEQRKIELYDHLRNSNEYKIADLLLFNTGSEKIEWEYAPEIKKWDAHKFKWQLLIDKLDHWIMSHISFATRIDPWKMHPNPSASVRESQACTPGEFRFYENLSKKYFNLDFLQLLKHPSFKWEIEFLFHFYSDEYTLFLIKEVYPVCIPHKNPPSEIIKKAENFYNSALLFRADTMNSYLRLEKVFNQYFGEGEYRKRYGQPAPGPKTNAGPFKLEEFFRQL